MKGWLLTIFTMITLHISAQDTLKYWVQFTSKTNTPFSIDAPELFLSQRALLRRQVQHIPVTENDLPVDPAYVQAVRNTGFHILNRSRWFNAVTVSTNDTALIAQVLALSFVAGIDTVARLKRSPDPENTGGVRPIIERTRNDYGPSFNQIAMLNGDVLHDLGFTGNGMLIAVIDAGFKGFDDFAGFDRLVSDNRLLGTYDFVDQETEVVDGEGSSHGTAVLSTMASWLPGELIGTAYDASYYLLKSEEPGSELLIEEDNWIAAAEFADSAGVDVLNTSLGYTTFDDSTMDHTYAMMDGNTIRMTIGADIAASKGMLVVNSAGNEGNDSWYHISVPADGDSVLTIGGVDKNGSYLGFSGKGPASDGDIKPNVAAQGSEVVVADIGDGNTRTSSGTSFSSPIMAGMAASLWQAHPTRSNMEVFHAIEESASQYDHPDILIGYGIPDFLKAHLLLQQITNIDTARAPYIFPNPFHRQFTFYFEPYFDADADLIIYDALGRLIYQDILTLRNGSPYAIQFDQLTQANSGLYFLKLITPDQEWSFKLLKQ